MQRTIKFRGKRIDNGEWVYGYYHSCSGSVRLAGYISSGNYCVDIDKHWILVPRNPSDIGWTIRDTFTSFSVIPESIGQFTGLQDKNGKDIYEGDIIEQEVEITPDREDSYIEHWKGVVHFVDGGFYLKFNEYRTREKIITNPNHWTVIKFEVIGNIYESPELINNK